MRRKILLLITNRVFVFIDILILFCSPKRALGHPDKLALLQDIYVSFKHLYLEFLLFYWRRQKCSVKTWGVSCCYRNDLDTFWLNINKMLTVYCPHTLKRTELHRCKKLQCNSKSVTPPWKQFVWWGKWNREQVEEINKETPIREESRWWWLQAFSLSCYFNCFWWCKKKKVFWFLADALLILHFLQRVFPHSNKNTGADASTPGVVARPYSKLVPWPLGVILCTKWLMLLGCVSCSRPGPILKYESSQAALWHHISHQDVESMYTGTGVFCKRPHQKQLNPIDQGASWEISFCSHGSYF